MSTLKGLVLWVLVLMFCLDNVTIVQADKVDDLIKQLKDESQSAREEVAEALGNIGKPKNY
jgi:HEAT repeat protein